MTKLTVSMKDTICVKALDHAFKAEKKALSDSEETLSEAVYDAVLDEKTRVALAACPESFLIRRDYAYVRFAGIDSLVTFSTSRPGKANGECLGILDAYHPLTAAWRKLSGEKKDLRERTDAAKAAITAVLDSVTTVKRLLEVWPECAPFIPAMAAKVNLPAVQTDALNTLLKLPVPK